MKTKMISIIVILAVVATALCSCNALSNLCTLRYKAGEGGIVMGELKQKVAKGGSGEAVVAFANDGYYFTGWSDGVTSSIRQDTNVSDNLTVTAQFEKTVPQQKTFLVQYYASNGGSVQGETTQQVEPGNDATPVTAVANDGYEFVAWSDGVATATRQEKAVSANVTATAVFKKYQAPDPLTKTFTLNYNFGNSDEQPQQITFVENETEGITLPVLTREHFTFHGWYCNDEQVADTNGRLLLQNELLTLESEQIYAKFTANETFTYKILLVYPTRIDAMLYYKDLNVKEKVHVDYTMSEQERELCHLLTLRIKRELDLMLDGLVEFQVDEYFTTETIHEDSYELGGNQLINNDLFPKNIAEVKDLVDNYDSCIAMTNHGEKGKQVHMSAGTATIKYGDVRIDEFLAGAKSLQFSMDEVLELFRNNEDIHLYDNVYLIADYMMEPFFHEHAHTIELRMNLFDYHNCVAIGQNKKISSFETNRAYYLHEFDVDGQKVGIPYKFWNREFAKLTYLVSRDYRGDQGYVISERPYLQLSVGSGCSVIEAIYGDYVTVTAVPFQGLRFVKWSDGVTTAERTDLITGDFTVTAIFEEIE